MNGRTEATKNDILQLLENATPEQLEEYDYINQLVRILSRFSPDQMARFQSAAQQIIAHAQDQDDPRKCG